MANGMVLVVIFFVKLVEMIRKEGHGYMFHFEPLKITNLKNLFPSLVYMFCYYWLVNHELAL